MWVESQRREQSLVTLKTKCLVEMNIVELVSGGHVQKNMHKN